MTAPAEVAVVGAGVVGLCAAHALRLRGVPVVVYEPGVPGNAQSGGPSRVFRHAHDDPRMIAAARASRALWREWGGRLGVEAVSGDGAVAIGDAVPRRLALLEEDGGVPARALAPDELAALMPWLARYDGPAMLDPDGGAIRTDASIAALAAGLGEALVADEVIALRLRDDGRVDLVAGGGTRRVRHALVCAGRGTEALVRPLGIVPPVRHAAHIRLTFRMRGAPPARLPCLQDSSGAFGESAVYAAALPGNAAIGLGIAEDVDAGPGAVDAGLLEAAAERAGAYVGRALPGVDPHPVGSRACWVTKLPWGADGVAVWRAGGVLALAGHNLFKQGPVLGEALADMVTGAEPALDLRPEARMGSATPIGRPRTFPP
ncbi:MAG: NAD(P)/FAD-dependent oxidoreductase [Thermoleophilia bacterium]